MSGLFSNYSLRSKKRQTSDFLVHSVGQKPVVLWKYFNVVVAFCFVCFLQHGRSTKSQCGRSYVTLQRLTIVQRHRRKSREAGYEECVNDGIQQ